MAKVNLNQLGNELNRLTAKKLMTINTETKTLWSITCAEWMKTELTDTIKTGLSPVAGIGRYKAYSPFYKNQITNNRKFKRKYPDKRIRPVNLWLSGKMLNSIKSKITKYGFNIWFSDKKAEYHDKIGAGRSKVIRKMLPDYGQNFTRAIMRQLVDIYDTLIKNEIRKS